MLKKAVVITILLVLGHINGCPDTCCIDASIFKLQEDKCVLTKDSQHLAMELVQEMANSDENLFISPFSVTNILQLLLLASAGTTTEMLSEALSAATVDIHEATKCLSEKVLKPSDQTLNSTNDFFVSSSYPAKNHTYIKKAMEYYGAYFHNCNFERRPERARRRINMIVAVKSNYLINNLFAPGSVNNDTKSIIVNTISFRSNWKQQFDKKLTRIGNFYVKPGKPVETSLMRVEGAFSRKWLSNILQSEYRSPIPVEILDMPYESSQFSMMAIKYSEQENYFEDLGLIEQFVSRTGILKVRDSLQSRPLAVTFPRFKMEYDRDLNDIFTPATGLGIVFSPRANYSNFVDELYISNIIHKAAIVVTEEGTVASAASGGHFIQRGSQMMTFNTPFVFYIYHACDGLVLFQGRYAYPPEHPVEVTGNSHEPRH